MEQAQQESTEVGSDVASSLQFVLPREIGVEQLFQLRHASDRVRQIKILASVLASLCIVVTVIGIRGREPGFVRRICPSYIVSRLSFQLSLPARVRIRHSRLVSVPAQKNPGLPHRNRTAPRRTLLESILR